MNLVYFSKEARNTPKEHKIKKQLQKMFRKHIALLSKQLHKKKCNVAYTRGRE